MNTPDHRDNLGVWLNAAGLTGEGAEIGVAAGNFSRQILETWKGRMLHMVDLWHRQDPGIYKESTNHEAPFDKWRDEAMSVAAQHPGRTILHQFESTVAAATFWDGSLDFVYIDANHGAEAVNADLSAWWPKVRPSGLVGGHDFLTKHDEGWWCEVEAAVTQWTRERSLPFTVTPCSSFWIRKL